MNIVHRDVSPQNVLVSYEGELKVVDFGIASEVLSSKSLQTVEDGISGTVEYMSPEQLAGSPVCLDDVLHPALCRLAQILLGEN